MKISEYNQMMSYLTRREPTTKESKGAYDKFVKKGKDGFAPPKKRDILDHINQVQHTYDGVPLNENNKKINAMAKGGVIKDPTFTKYNTGGTAKNIKKNKKSENKLSGEDIEFMKWFKKNPNKTYNDWLKKDKTLEDLAILTEDQKKDPKIIDLSPYLPTFEEELKRMEQQKKEEEKKETLENFILRRSREMKLAEADSSGLPNILGVRR